MAGALVPLSAVVRDRAPYFPAGRANAAFVAHLIATSIKAPQTRLRRRAEPAEAAATYGGKGFGLGQWPSPSGRALSQSL